MSAWWRAARPLAHGNIAPPIVLGQAWAFAETGRFEVTAAIVAHGFGLLDHLFIVFGNDVADLEGDRHNHTSNLFSGGSRVLVEGRLSPGSLAAAAAFMALGMGTLAFAWQARPWLPLFWVAALALLWLYSFPPARLSYRGGGAVLQGLGVGAVLPLLGYYAQRGSLAEMPWESLAVLVTLGVAGNILTALPDEPADRQVGKRSWPVRRGSFEARRHALLLIALALALVPFVTRHLTPVERALVVAVPSLAALASLRDLRDADADNRRACLRFIVLAAGAGASLQLLWALTLFV